LHERSLVAGYLCPAFVFSGHTTTAVEAQREREGPEKMHLSENEGIEGVRFAVTGGQGFVGAALCLELLRRGAREVRSLDLRAASTWSQQLLDAGVHIIQGHCLPLTVFSSDRCLHHQITRGFTLLSLWMCSANVVVAEFTVSWFAGLEELTSPDLPCRELQN